MKKITTLLKKVGLISAIILLAQPAAFSATFTAVASGNWSSSATWGGSAPSSNIMLDQVIIPSGITVDLDNNVTFNGALTSLDVAGTLTTTSSASITIASGTISGAGDIIVEAITTGTGAIVLFTGSLTANAMNNTALSLQLAADVDVQQTLTLASGGVISLISGGSLMVGNNATVVIESGGIISVSGGALGFSGAYNVTYTGGSSSAGLELTGAGLSNINVNVGAGNSVTLSSSLTVDGTLSMTSGTLAIGNNTLTFGASGNLAAGGSGTISVGTGGNIIVNASAGLTGTLTFSSSGNVANNVTINVGSGTGVQISSNLTVTGTLTLSGGSNINVTGVDLTISGDLSGSGSLIVDAGTNITIDASGGLSAGLSFIGGSGTVGDITINVGAGNDVEIDGNLTVTGTLTIQSGNLVLNGLDLTVNGDLNISADGAIDASASSDITIDVSAAPSTAINFSSTGNIVGNFELNISSGGTLMLGSDLTVEGDLSFSGSGSIDIGNNDIQIGAGGSISGAGSSSYIITSGSGQVGIGITAGGSTVEFPVGTSINFAPAMIELNSGSASGNVMVSVVADVRTDGYVGADISGSQPLVDATWSVNSDISANLDLNLEVIWSTAMEVNGFNNTSVYLSHYTNGNWDASATASATVQGGGMFSISRANITSLSPFAVFDNNTVVSVREEELLPIISIYPNPATDHVVIKNAEEFDNPVNAQIMNINGQLIGSYIIDADQTTISLDHLTKGSYFIRLYNDDISIVKKILKL